ncbi:splicing factor [Linderina pennispora]|nr:splicing factor [Linderina pennispora]
MSQEINVEELLDAPFKRETEVLTSANEDTADAVDAKVNAKLNASSPTAVSASAAATDRVDEDKTEDRHRRSPAYSRSRSSRGHRRSSRRRSRTRSRSRSRSGSRRYRSRYYGDDDDDMYRRRRHYHRSERRYGSRYGDDDDDRYYRRSSRYSDDRSEYRRPSSRRQSRSPSRSNGRRRSSNATRSPSPAVDDADRDLRTVFAMQLSANLTRRDLMEFFAKAGRVRDAHIVSDKGSRRSRGVAYVEFYSIESAMKAVELSNERLLGVPIIVQPSEAEKNRQASLKQYSAAGVPMNRTTPINSMIHVDGLVVNMESSDLRMIFEQFGPVVHCRVMQARDAKGDVIENEWAAAVKYASATVAQLAAEKMNGFDLVGSSLRVRMATKTELEREETLARSEVSKLVAGSGISPATVPAAQSTAPGTPAETESAIRSVAVLLTNMFDPAEETEPTWVEDLSDDVRDECVKYGRVERVFVDRESCGNIYLKFADEEAAELARKAMNHRWFGGRQVVAQFIPVERFEDAVSL